MRSVASVRTPMEVIRTLLQRSRGQISGPDEDEQTTMDRSPENKWFPVVTEPQEVGDELLRGGEFGRLGPYLQTRESPYTSLAKRFRDLRTRQGHFVREDLSRVIYCIIICSGGNDVILTSNFAAHNSQYVWYHCCPVQCKPILWPIFHR